MYCGYGARFGSRRAAGVTSLRSHTEPVSASFKMEPSPGTKCIILLKVLSYLWCSKYTSVWRKHGFSPENSPWIFFVFAMIFKPVYIFSVVLIVPSWWLFSITFWYLAPPFFWGPRLTLRKQLGNKIVSPLLHWQMISKPKMTTFMPSVTQQLNFYYTYILSGYIYKIM